VHSSLFIIAVMKILHLEDSDLDHALVCRALTKGADTFAVQRVEVLSEFLSHLEKTEFDVVLADYRLSGFTALDAWSAACKNPKHPPFILVSGAIGESAAVEAIHLGISDYVHKSNLDSLWRVIHRTIDVFQTKMDQAQAHAALADSEKRLAEFTEHLQSTIEFERAAIAREIHDDIGGSLAAVKFDLGWLSRHVTDDAHKNHIDSAGEMLQHALGASQRIMMDLRPAILDQGLFAALQWLTSSFSKRTGIHTSLTSNQENFFLDRTLQLTAYRTVQESLTNIAKHAHCEFVKVDVSDAEKVLTVEISDNGLGIKESDLSKLTSFGIKGLQERAKSVGGWLDVSTNHLGGTSITLSVPLSVNIDCNEAEAFE
jgi:two-component system, NarL family, sensor histidine kinase UhpB